MHAAYLTEFVNFFSKKSYEHDLFQDINFNNIYVRYCIISCKL